MAEKLKKRKDGRYAKQVVTGYKEGKPIKKTVYGKTLKEVDKNYRDLMSLIDKGAVLESQNTKVYEFLQMWYEVKKVGKITTNTILAYERKMKLIKNTDISEMRVKDVKYYHVKTLIDKLEVENGVSIAKETLVVLKSMFNYAMSQDIIIKNPCNDITVKYKPKIRRPLNETETVTITNIDKYKLDEKSKIFTLILRYTGMRRGEVLALAVNDIDRKTLMIHINKTLIDNNARPIIQHRTKTSAGMRSIPLFVPLIKPLFSYIDKLDSEYLFLNKNGNLYSSYSVTKMFTKIKKRLKLGDDLTIHCFRHNFISECYKAKIDIKKTQSWVGHSDIKTTLSIYTHLEESEIKNGDEMNNFYGSQTEVKPTFAVVQSQETQHLQAVQ